MGMYSDVIETEPRVDLNHHAFGNEVVDSFGNAPHILGLRQVDDDKLIAVLIVTAWCSSSHRKSLHGSGEVHRQPPVCIRRTDALYPVIVNNTAGHEKQLPRISSSLLLYVSAAPTVITLRRGNRPSRYSIASWTLRWLTASRVSSLHCTCYACCCGSQLVIGGTCVLSGYVILKWDVQIP